MTQSMRRWGGAMLLSLACGCAVEAADELAEAPTPEVAAQPLLTGGAYLESVLQLGQPKLQRVWGVDSDGAGGIVAVGTFRDQVDVQPGRGVHLVYGAGELDGFLVRYSEGHKVLWARSFGATGFDELFDVVVSAGSLYAVGYEMDPVTHVTRGVVANFMLSNGALRWKKTLDSAYGCEARAIALEAGGDIVVGGSYSFEIDLDLGPGVRMLTASVGGRQGYLAQYSSGGTLRWHAGVWGASGSVVRGVAVKHSGQVAVVGELFGGGSIGLRDPLGLPGYGLNDGFVALFDRYGAEQWAHTLGGPETDSLRGVAFHPDWGVVTGGFFRAKARVHNKASDTQFSRGGSDMIYAAYALSGGLNWHRSFGGPADDAVHDIYVDGPENALYSTGFFSKDVDFAFTSQPPFYLSAVTAKISSFTARYDVSGKPLLDWADGPEGIAGLAPSSAVGDAITLGPGKEVWSAGTFQGQIKYPAGPSLSAPDLDGLIVRYFQTP